MVVDDFVEVLLGDFRSWLLEFHCEDKSFHQLEGEDFLPNKVSHGGSYIIIEVIFTSETTEKACQIVIW